MVYFTHPPPEQTTTSALTCATRMAAQQPWQDVCRIKDRERRRAEGEKPAPFGGMRHTGPPPPAHPFSASEARNAGLLVESRRGIDNHYVMENRRFVNGYEIRKLPVRVCMAVMHPELCPMVQNRTTSHGRV